MTLLRANNKTLYFAHIPKTGGTSIAATIRDSGAKQALHHGRRIGGLRCPPQHMHAELFNAMIPKAFYDAAMTVVRNPYVRIASEYSYRTQLERKWTTFDNWLDDAFKKYERNAFAYDNHIRPQLAFTQDHIQVFRFEDGVGAAVDFGCSALGLDPIETKHHKKGKSRPLNASDKSIETIREFYLDDFSEFGYDPDAVPERLAGR